MADAAAADRAAMPPPPSRPGSKRKVVLEEDTFAEAIEAIIERDFFPALPKLQNQLEWLQAVQSGDPAQIKRAQLNIARRRAGVRTPLAHDGTAAPGTAALTPGTGLLRTPAMTPAVGSAAAAAAATPARTPAGAAAAAALQQQGLDPVSAQQAVGAKAPSLGLDQFFSSYQGEDNASFQQIQKKTIERKRAKMVHHLQDKNTPLLLEAGGHSTDEYGTSGQAPSTVLSTRHEPKSALYYDSSQRQALALTAAEQAAMVQGPPKSINLAATRSICAGPLQEPMAAPPAAAAPARGSISVPAAAVVVDAAAAAGGEGSAEQRQADRLAAAAVAPGTRGYGYMKTPQIVPGVDASPLMTWGDIASTPLRLDGTDHDIEGLGVLGEEYEDGVPGRQFTMPQVRTREVAAQQMHASRSAAVKRRGGAGAAGVGGGASGLGGRPGSATPLLDSLRRGSSSVRLTGQRSGAAGSTPVHGLSAAGLKLAKQLGKGSRPGTGARAGSGAGSALAGSAADLQLRASYKGGSGAAATPVRVGAGAGVASGGWDMTPGRAAAGAGSSRQLSGKVHVQAGSGAGGRAAAAKAQQPAAGASVTDDLLQLG